MSDRMVSCVRLFAFRKDISMNNKDRKRQIAYEVLMILGSLALLTFICRLWPILLLIILGIFVAAIRLLFLSGNRVDPVEPQPLLPAPISAPTESDLRKLAHKKAQSNKWWKEKIRQTLQINPMHFTHDGRGLWSLNRNAA